MIDLPDSLRRIVNQAVEVAERNGDFGPQLPPDGQDRTFPHMSELIDAKIAASEARTDTKFAQLDTRFAKIDARFDQMFTRMDGISEELRGMRTENMRTRDTVRNTAIALFFGLAGLFIAIVFGLPAVYGLGTSTRDIIQSEVQKAVSQPVPKQ